MKSSRSFLDRFYVCCNKIDGLYYLAARRLGVKENALSLLYTQRTRDFKGTRHCGFGRFG